MNILICPFDISGEVLPMAGFRIQEMLTNHETGSSDVTCHKTISFIVACLSHAACHGRRTLLIDYIQKVIMT